MSDLISRQAAIDALEAIGQNYNLAKAYVVGVIEELPSAQPETQEERTETHACDCISRKEAIDALENTKEVAR